MQFDWRRFAARTVVPIFLAGNCLAQTVEDVIVGKGREYIQSSPTTVTPNPTPCQSGCPFNFFANVHGQNLASMAAPVLSGPVNVSTISQFWNNGRLVFNGADQAWRLGIHADDWSSPTQAALDSIYGSGIYTIVVNGTSIALNLTGDAYPNVPVATLSGGKWLNGKYVVDATKPFSGTTNAYAGYGTHVDDVISLFGQDQFHSAVPGANTSSVTIPANTLVNGREYTADATFAALVDVKPNASLPGSINAAVYRASTIITIKTEAPVFPMTVSSNIGATASTATANVGYRPQDVGTTASVFVFAHVPASLLGLQAATLRAPLGPSIRGMLMDGAPNPCVLAQLNSNGQLAPVSASTMQAYTTGVLSSQGQSVTILNNVSTPSIAGAAFYVGYGTNASTMISNGIYQGAVTVPGTSQCSAGAAPASPGALTGLWWNAAESGWGIHFTQRGPNVFAAWYTYDSTGKPKWYVSTCTGFSGGVSGTCNGTLFEVTGPAFFGASFNPALVHATNAGTVRVAFSDANHASMTYTAGGQTRTVAIVRQPLAAGTTAPAVDYTDLWWSPDESGWGMAIAQQYGVTFLAWYVYDSSGKPTWYVATGAMNGSSTSATLYRTTGPAFGPSFDPSAVQAIAAGTVSVDFTDANNATLSYTVGGVTATKTTTRQLF